MLPLMLEWLDNHPLVLAAIIVEAFLLWRNIHFPSERQ
jgi:hypothetical protein